MINNVDVVGLLTKVGIAIIILVVTWLVALLIKWIIKKLVSRVGFLRKQGADGAQVGDSIGTVASLLVWLLGLIAVLQVFQLQQVLAPLQGLLNGILGVLPNLIGALFIFIIGYVFAKIARQLVTTALGAVNLSKFSKAVSAVGSKVGEVDDNPYRSDRSASRVNNLPKLVGNLVFAVIIVTVSIAALQVLGIAAISIPAQQMLTGFLNAIPPIAAAVVLLAIGWVIANFVSQLVDQLLTSLDIDRAAVKSGIVPKGTRVGIIITRIVQVAIILFFAVMATRLLGFPEITNIINQILSIGGRVLFGGAIILAGFLIANLIARLVGSSLGARVVRYATIALFAAIGLQAMGIANSIVNLAFGAVVVGGALAAALAFGLGGRDAAARTLNKVSNSIDAEVAKEKKAAKSASR